MEIPDLHDDGGLLVQLLTLSKCTSAYLTCMMMAASSCSSRALTSALRMKGNCGSTAANERPAQEDVPVPADSDPALPGHHMAHGGRGYGGGEKREALTGTVDGSEDE